VSWGKGCGNAAYPGIYARVSHYADWLDTARSSAQVVTLNAAPLSSVGDSTGANPASWQHFSFEVPPGVIGLNVSMEGTNIGDADLYVRRGGAPTLAKFDCAPRITPVFGKNVEWCSVAAPAAGTWHVAVQGYSAYSNLKLRAWFRYDSNATRLDVANAALADGNFRHYGPFAVSPGNRFFARVEANSGNPDLYVRWGAAPTTATYSCRPFLAGAADELCALKVPPGVTSAYVAVRARGGPAGYDVVAAAL
jgi:vibriolysin